MNECFDEYNSEDSKNEIIAESVREIEAQTNAYADFLIMLSQFNEELQWKKKNGMPSGVQFILMYYMNLLNKPVFYNNTKDGEILVALLNNGSAEEFRRWLTNFERQKAYILDINQKSLEQINLFSPTQPLTYRNMQKACKLLEDLNLKDKIKEPFIILDILESLEK